MESMFDWFNIFGTWRVFLSFFAFWKIRISISRSIFHRRTVVPSIRSSSTPSNNPLKSSTKRSSKVTSCYSDPDTVYLYNKNKQTCHYDSVEHRQHHQQQSNAHYSIRICVFIMFFLTSESHRKTHRNATEIVLPTFLAQKYSHWNPSNHSSIRRTNISCDSF